VLNRRISISINTNLNTWRTRIWSNEWVIKFKCHLTVHVLSNKKILENIFGDIMIHCHGDYSPIVNTWQDLCVFHVSFAFLVYSQFYLTYVTSNWPLWSIRHCTVYYRRTCPKIVNSPLTPAVASYYHLIPIYVSYLALTAVLVTEVSPLPALHYGTVYHHHFGQLITDSLRSNSSWKLICSDETSAHLWHFVYFAHCTNVLTYFTYLSGIMAKWRNSRTFIAAVECALMRTCFYV